MKKVDISQETLKVGNALASVRLDQMILSLAKGIAWGQYDLDKVGMEITKMMGVPGTVSIGKDDLSMLDAGFLPSFYHFVDTILELKMEVNVRQEQTEQQKTSVKDSYSTMSESKSSSSRKLKVGYWGASYESNARHSSKTRSKAAYSKTVDATHAQKYSQDLSATSLMRTKLVPKPAPEVLVERIKILLERMKEEAKEEAKTDNPDDIFDKMMEKIMTDF